MLHIRYLICLLFLFVQIDNGVFQASKICPDLVQRLEKAEKLNVLVSFSNGVKTAIAKTKSLRHNSRDARNIAIKEELQKNADESQQGVISLLLSRSSGGEFKDYVKFWIGNTLLVKDADHATVKAIADDPQVSKVQAEPIYKIPQDPNEMESSIHGPTRPPKDRYWNMPLIQLTEAWAELNGSKGEGVLVANIDTGVNHTHGLLRHNYRGQYGFYDGVENKTEPYDGHGHGTGCMSILAGSSKGENGPPIGVAPGATWMACVGCNSEGDCKYEYLARCWQFIACPTLPDGSNEDCSKAPHVLSYSIAEGTEPKKDLEELLALQEMGIIIVAGIGNDGPNCSTALYPASSEHIIAVGATNWKDEVWEFSSRGPTNDGRIKPDLVAPGMDVAAAANSAIHNNLTLGFRGTSFATPHVAGVVALLHVRDPELTPEVAHKLVTETTDRSVNVSWPFENQTCSEDGTVPIPSNMFGWGRLNALRAVQAQTKLLAEKGN